VKLSTSIETRTEVELAPHTAAVLIANLDTYHDLVLQRKILDAAIDHAKETIGEMVTETGYEALAIASSKITLVRGVSSTLDKKKLLAMGVTLAQLDAATVVKPKKPYWKISGAGDE